MRPCPSATAWILVVRPPLDRPIAWFCSPPFPPAAERCARTEVLSTMAMRGGSAQATRAAKMSCQRPRWLQRLNRLNTVVRGP